MYRWKTDEDGLIVVTKEDGNLFIPTLTGKQAAVLDSVLARWGDLARAIAEQNSIPDRWLLAMIYQESAGYPRAFRREPSGLTGIGLVQITSPSLKGEYSDEQLFDPHLNLSIGARYIRQIAARPDVAWDWPKVSATFNAGSPRPSSENQWNLFCYGNHVDAEVSANNYQVLRVKADPTAAAQRAYALVDLTLEDWERNSDGSHKQTDFDPDPTT